jgi:hypothetical protein
MMNAYKNGNQRVAIAFYEGMKKPYWVNGSVFDGVKWQISAIGKYKTLRGAIAASTQYRSYFPGTWEEIK